MSNRLVARLLSFFTDGASYRGVTRVADVRKWKHIPTSAFRVGDKKWSLRDHQTGSINAWKEGGHLAGGFSVDGERLSYTDMAGTVHHVDVDYDEVGRILHSVYEKGYEFPERALSDLRSEAKVYYYLDDDLESIIQLSIQREPVRFVDHKWQLWDQTTHFNKQRMKKYFGWEKGAYAGYTARAAPTFAVYCKPLIYKRSSSPVQIHLINLIGYAFDHPEQPDYMRLIS